MTGVLTRAEWELNEAIQDSLIALVEAHGATPVYVYVSGPWTRSAQKRRRDWVKRVAAEHGAAILDLTDPIHSADPDVVFLPSNSHYSATGHRIVADTLHEFLLEQVARAVGPSRDST
jgi:hypothetical protein